MMYYNEIRKTTKRTGSPELVEWCRTHMYVDKGYKYKSMYAYPEDVADKIRTNGHTRGLKGCTLYSHTIYIDVDDDTNIEEVLNILHSEQIPFYHFDTGNRGAHFHIPILPMIGVHVIYSQIEWLKDVGLWNLIDQSIYREGGQIRMVHAVHEKTGRKKKVVYGPDLSLKTLEVPHLVPPPVPKPSYEIGEGDDADKQIYFMNLMRKCREGQRHTHMYIIWRSGLRAGFDPETVKESIRNWNNMQDIPHREDVVEKKLEGFK